MLHAGYRLYRCLSVKELCTVCGADGVNYKHAYRFGQAQFVTALIVDGKKTTAATGDQ